jgi:superfamily II DNA helicase RecQ
MIEQIADTLESILVPGRRFRLSPLIEATQLRVLFGESPDDRRRAESIRAILASHVAERKLAELAETYDDFSSRKKPFSEENTYRGTFLETYLGYYTTVHAPKLQLLLTELIRLGKLPQQLKVLDIGVGPGTTALAFFDFVLLWGAASRFWGAPVEPPQITFVGIDRSDEALGFARRVTTALADEIERWQRERTGYDDREPSVRAQAWTEAVVQAARSARWERVDLTDPAQWSRACDLSRQSTVIVASYVLRELRDAGVERVLDHILSAALPGAVALVLESGKRVDAGGLARWRRSFLQSARGWLNLGPCGQEFGRELPATCDRCWAFRREALLQPQLWQAIVERTAAYRQACEEKRDNRYDEFENELLSWSYVLLERSDGDRPLGGVTRKTWQFEAGGVVEQFQARAVGAFVDKNKSIECLKLCPGSGQDSLTGIALEDYWWYIQGRPRYGELLRISRVVVRPERPGRVRLVPRDDTVVESLECRRMLVKETGRRDEHWQPSEEALEALDEIAYRFFGFPRLRPFQRVVLQRVLAGRSTLAIAATGSGKSECYILPAMLMPGFTVVVSPLKSLMQDQYEQRIRDRYGLDLLATYLNSDVPYRERELCLQRVRQGYYKLVYVTPEQLERDWVVEALRDADRRVPGGLRYLAFDEAHCISQWGHDFRPAYLNIVRRLRQRGLHPVLLALTATASRRVREDICTELGLDPRPVEEGGDVLVDAANRPELNLVVQLVPDHQTKAELVVRYLSDLQHRNAEGGVPGAAIVFLPHTGELGTARPNPQSSRVADFALWLQAQLNMPVSVYHGRMEEERSEGEGAVDDDASNEQSRLETLIGRTRREQQRLFVSDKHRVMVATKGFGMGIDKPNVRLILHRTPPSTLEAYWQEAGRAGRDGGLATVVLLFATDLADRVEARDTDDSQQAEFDNLSDYDIQRFFIEQRYADPQALQLMALFLSQLKPGKAGTIYFTGDEVIAFFEARGFKWTEPPKRHQYPDELEEHKTVLDRGHKYAHQLRYIDRILQVMQSNVIPVGNTVLTFVESAHELASHIHRPQLKVAIDRLFTGTYGFARLLRELEERWTGARRFRVILREMLQRKWFDLRELADLLGCSLREAYGLLTDIKYSEGEYRRVDNRDAMGGVRAGTVWESWVLDFLAIVPCRGPASGKWRLDDWLSYAGAVKRASREEARWRANRANRNAPSLTDWFGWREAAPRRGWEVRLGSAFLQPEILQQAIEVLIQRLEQRKQHDWEAYHRLLSEYVGVERVNGRWQPRSGELPCLRSVVLGYLDTGETVVGGNCLGCSRCVPDGSFSSDLSARRNRVVRLGSDLGQLLAELERQSDTWPAETALDRLAELVELERSTGREIGGYLLGWTDRVLTEEPDHRAALVVRFLAACRGWISIPAEELARLAERLVEAAS